MSSIEYDVYYSTGGVSNIGGGSDVWVRHWIEEIAPKLNKPFKLLIDNELYFQWAGLCYCVLIYG